MALVTGTQLGPYKILGILGRGGMGEVYRAMDTRLDREVAIKVLPEHLAESKDALERFQREAKAIASLSHPNILAIHDFGGDSGPSYAVTELLEGETLRSAINRGAIGWRKAIEIGTAVAEGLAAAHSKRVIHRDLKPENIFLTSDDRVKILDFGLARFVPKISSEEVADAPTEANLTESGIVMGTVPYMSPEQVRGESVDARSDIFSFGCVLHEMLTGKRAFHGNSSAETISAILRDPPTELPATVPTEVMHIIEHCLEKNPGKRFQSAHDLVFALREVGTTQGVRPVAAHKWLRFGPLLLSAVIGLIAIAALFFTFRKRPTSPAEYVASKIQSLAVLPLTNLSGDPQQEYFSDGMTEALITDLAKIRSLKVISRTSVMQFKQTTKPLPEIARELKVEAIVEGSVIRSGNRVRITAQLIDASSDRHLWAESYERNLSDILTLQGEVANAIANKIQATLTPQERSRLTAAHRVQPDAHEAFLKGRYFWSQWTPEGFRKAIEFFEQATTIDPNYGEAYAGLADCYSTESEYGLVDPSDGARKAEAAALKALELDETLADAHVSLGLVNEKYKWDWPLADRELHRAVELQPGSARAHLIYARYLAEMGRLDEAITEINRARELDPLSAVTNATMAMISYFARQYDRAIEQCRATLEIDNNFLWAHHLMGEDYIEKGMYKEALAALQKSVIGSEINPHFEAIIGYAYARAGNREEARKVIVKLKNAPRETYVPPAQIALIYGGLNEKDQALLLLERAFKERDSSLIDINVVPYFDPLRGDPRFQDLLRRMNFPKI